MEERTMKIIQEMGGNIKYELTENGKVEPIVEFPPDKEDCDRPPLTFNLSDEPSFEPVLCKICESVDLVQDSASGIIFLVYYTFHQKHNLTFFFGLIERGVPFKQAFDIIQSLYFIGYIADNEPPSNTMLDYMLIITEYLASEVSSVLLSLPKGDRDTFWKKGFEQSSTDFSDIGITEEEF